MAGGAAAAKGKRGVRKILYIDIAASPAEQWYTNLLSPQIARAGQWLLHSGIQDSDGGVARYYRVDLERNLSVSTEITGYAASAFALLHWITGDPLYCNRAAAAVHFLEAAWDTAEQVMPFEIDSPRLSYFFDCGIIARGLLFAGGSHEIAGAIARSMARDFDSGRDFHPILALPGKCAQARDPLRWSRSAGCYQLKAATAWTDLADPDLAPQYRRVLEDSLRTYESYLPGHPDPEKVVDRLH